MFGKVDEVPQTERARFHPRWAYGISKVAGFELTRNYREAYGLHASSEILFNHESSRRGYELVTRKITAGVAAIATGKQKGLQLGNLEARRDWGFAREYVEAMWLMVGQDQPDDYVICTGEAHSVREFAEAALAAAGLDYQDRVVVGQELHRPVAWPSPHCRPGGRLRRLGWRPKTPFQSRVRWMVDADLRALGVEAPSAARRMPRAAPAG
jgi:GDPmannose 4,6-dehydratase